MPNDPAYLLHIDPQSKPGLIWNPQRVTKLDTNTIAIKGTTVSPPDQLTGEARQYTHRSTFLYPLADTAIIIDVTNVYIAPTTKRNTYQVVTEEIALETEDSCLQYLRHGIRNTAPYTSSNQVSTVRTNPHWRLWKCVVCCDACMHGWWREGDSRFTSRSTEPL